MTFVLRLTFTVLGSDNPKHVVQQPLTIIQNLFAFRLAFLLFDLIINLKFFQRLRRCCNVNNFFMGLAFFYCKKIELYFMAQRMLNIEVFVCGGVLVNKIKQNI